MLEFIPNLMYACRMIYTISHYYTTSDRMTYLLSKVIEAIYSKFNDSILNVFSIYMMFLASILLKLKMLLGV